MLLVLLRLTGAFGIMSACANGPAVAKTQAACKKEYAAKKAAGEATGQKEQNYVRACLAPDKAAPAPAAGAKTAGDAEAEDSSEIAKKLQNPIGDLYSFPFQSNTNFQYGPHKGTQEILNIQPVIPIHVNEDWNVITRTILPLVWNPSLSPIDTVPFGTGPTTFSAFLSPRNPTNGWLWGLGPVVQIPTISSTTLGSNVWGAGRPACSSI